MVPQEKNSWIPFRRGKPGKSQCSVRLWISMFISSRQSITTKFELTNPQVTIDQSVCAACGFLGWRNPICRWNQRCIHVLFIDVYRFYLLRFSLWNPRSLLLEFRQIQISENIPCFKQQIVSSFKSIVIEPVFYWVSPKIDTQSHWTSIIVFPFKGYTPFSDTTKSHCCLCSYIPRDPKTHDDQFPVLMVNWSCLQTKHFVPRCQRNPGGGQQASWPHTPPLVPPGKQHRCSGLPKNFPCLVIVIWKHGDFLKWGTPIAGWFMIENHVKMVDLAVRPFQETPTWLSTNCDELSISLNFLETSNPITLQFIVFWVSHVQFQGLSQVMFSDPKKRCMKVTFKDHP